MSLLDRPTREDSASAGTSPRITEEVFLETMSNVAATVTVVTTMVPDGTACGLTVSAFCSCPWIHHWSWFRWPEGRELSRRSDSPGLSL
jgi:hypothetical protein